MNLTEYQNYHESKAHTSFEFPYNTYLCCIPVDFIHVPIHWHNEMELIVIQKGSGIISVDFHSQTVKAGDIVFVLPGQLHSIEQEKEERMEYENILFHPSMLLCSEPDLCGTDFILPLVENPATIQTFLTPDTPAYPSLSECIRKMDHLCDLRPKGYQLAVKGWLFQLMFHLVSNQKAIKQPSSSQQKHRDKLKTILKHVEEHYSEPLTIEDMANLIHYSKSHFMKFFKTHMNTGFTQYLNHYRLTMAARLLVSTEDSILTIASSSGFDNLSYFNRLFRREFQMTPKQYRKANEYSEK